MRILTKYCIIREIHSQTDLVGTQNTYICILHFIKQLNEAVKSQVPYIGHTFGQAQPSGLVPNPFAERSCDKICSNQCVFYMSIHVCVDFI